MKTKIETLNKARAEYYLSVNPINRPINWTKVNQYKSDMNDGKWKENTGEAIKISIEGYLIDGQHRLMAFAKSNLESISFLVVYDLYKEIFDVLDTGKPRGANDVFALNNIVNSTVLVSAIRGYVSFKGGKNYLATGKDLNTTTNAALLAKYNELPDYYDDVANISKRLYASFNKVLPTSIIGMFYLLFHEKNIEKCDLFFNQLCKDEDVTNSSIKTLKNFLIRDKISLKKVSPTIKYAFIVKTWNAFILNKEIKTLKWDNNIENFPTIL